MHFTCAILDNLSSMQVIFYLTNTYTCLIRNFIFYAAVTECCYLLSDLRMKL